MCDRFRHRLERSLRRGVPAVSVVNPISSSSAASSQASRDRAMRTRRRLMNAAAVVERATEIVGEKYHSIVGDLPCHSPFILVRIGHISSSRCRALPSRWPAIVAASYQRTARGRAGPPGTFAGVRKIGVRCSTDVRHDRQHRASRLRPPDSEHLRASALDRDTCDGRSRIRPAGCGKTPCPPAKGRSRESAGLRLCNRGAMNSISSVPKIPALPACGFSPAGDVRLGDAEFAHAVRCASIDPPAGFAPAVRG